MKQSDTSIAELRKRIKSREVTAVDICKSAIEQIERLSELNAFLTVTADTALARAAEIDRAAEQGDELPPLAGTVVAIKDNIVIRVSGRPPAPKFCPTTSLPTRRLWLNGFRRRGRSLSVKQTAMSLRWARLTRTQLTVQ